MSKILIEGNKVIIDGHANDIETCNTLTNLCDELSKSDKFKMIKYQNGYGEFESIAENEKKKFEPPAYFITIKSNDGNTTLLNNFGLHSSPIVNLSGLYQSYEPYTGQIYTYSGDKRFVGLSRSANAQTPDYGIGSTINIQDEYYTLYIVEEEKTYQVLISSNGKVYIDTNGKVLQASAAIATLRAYNSVSKASFMPFYYIGSDGTKQFYNTENATVSIRVPSLLIPYYPSQADTGFVVISGSAEQITSGSGYPIGMYVTGDCVIASCIM